VPYLFNTFVYYSFLLLEVGDTGTAEGTETPIGGEQKFILFFAIV
jgi:hypothetical protein